MNRFTKQSLIIAGIIIFFFLIGIAGSSEYTEQVVYTMPQEAYETIYLKLGDDCSDKQIATEYMNNRKYYDSLSNY
ncbi:hypothetical protein HMPREF1017_00740 [Bacteroides ovatus 3_8_47FAA]|uniref:hypothetical protein n=1 Tax=Bacteroides ovatus TaxID=28116 RepID=UPI0002132040|nr:hypothetical protein [Bacteroides ovatus]EGN00214.1 hypothetical protein HMPREF1017_00740 [Bacteroides ovatus 3_8_47FAA]QGT70200.1 hypothetical protein FOC41_04135 [Bacteroides ovatus]